MKKTTIAFRAPAPSSVIMAPAARPLRTGLRAKYPTPARNSDVKPARRGRGSEAPRGIWMARTQQNDTAKLAASMPSAH